MELLDIALRGASSGILVLLAVLLWASRVSREAQISFSLLIVTLSARNWSTLPDATLIPAQALLTMRMVGVWGTLAITWFLLAIFLDNRRFSWAWLLSAVVISLSIILVQFAPAIVPVLRGYALLHFLGLLALVIYSGRDDLQDARRRLRPGMASFLLIYCIGMSITSSPMQDTRTVDMALFQSAGFLFFLAFFALWALKTNLNHWPGEITATPAYVEATQAAAQVTSQQNLLVSRIQHQMDAGVWKVEGLTVAALAQRVGAPEHQVRKAINQVLGHRNFASFINRARIDAAVARLADDASAGSTVLEIAYDVGFSSLGPFNRAFREVTGQSPTDFRKQQAGSVLA